MFDLAVTVELLRHYGRNTTAISGDFAKASSLAAKHGYKAGEFQQARDSDSSNAAHLLTSNVTTSAATMWPIWRRTRMRISIIAGSTAIALLALLGSAAPSQAYVPQPWCSDGTGNESGAPECAYSSYQQCVANAGECVANPAISPLPTAPGSTDFEAGRYRY